MTEKQSKTLLKYTWKTKSFQVGVYQILFCLKKHFFFLSLFVSIAELLEVESNSKLTQKYKF